MEKILFVDMDNVLVDLSEGFSSTFEELYEEKLFYDGISYDFLHNYDTITDDEKQEIYDRIFTYPNFWTRLKPYQDAIPVMEELNKHYDLFICSKPYNKNSMACTKEKLRWLKKFMPFLDLNKQVIFMADKFLLDGPDRIIIEDSIEHIEKWEQGVSILLSQPYNSNYDGATYTVENWKAIHNLLLG